MDNVYAKEIIWLLKVISSALCFIAVAVLAN